MDLSAMMNGATKEMVSVAHDDNKRIAWKRHVAQLLLTIDELSKSVPFHRRPFSIEAIHVTRILLFCTKRIPTVDAVVSDVLHIHACFSSCFHVSGQISQEDATSALTNPSILLEDDTKALIGHIDALL
jgi:hypothetical protein